MTDSSKRLALGAERPTCRDAAPAVCALTPPHHKAAAPRALGLLLALGLSISLPAGTASAQSSPTPATGTEPLGTFTEVVSVANVLVPVVVRAANGAYVKELGREDFRLFVDDRPVPIEIFEQRGEAPVSLVVLQDLSGSMATGGRLEASRDAISRMLSRAVPGDEFAMASFAGGGLLVDVPFTEEVSAVREAASLWEAYGTTALHDAVAWLPDIGAGGRHPKRAALLLTDGADNASQIPPAEARSIVRRSEIPVYVFGFDSGEVHLQTREGARLHRYAEVLNLLAAFTGGRYFALDGRTDVAAMVTTLLDELRNQYVLGFRMASGGGRGDHTLRVEVTGKRRTITNRQGYRGTLPAAWQTPPP